MPKTTKKPKYKIGNIVSYYIIECNYSVCPHCDSEIETCKDIKVSGEIIDKNYHGSLYKIKRGDRIDDIKESDIL